MDADRIDYQKLLQEALRDALRGAVRRVLAQVADEGLPGEHFFYIGFRTDRPGVQVPRFLRDQYPEEMTIVLQNQYWDLEVEGESFSVTLTFGGARQRLTIPFQALTAFADPSAEFGLRFDGGLEGVPAMGAASGPVRVEPEKRPAPAAGRSGEVVPFDPSRRK
ncbi:MAG TPA: ClpXP protease specificity-enhancing factor SspB [Thermoanaerobaculia bacterium]|nr:ClpXP protease specificity-enhancing factor SspB [Thermoanaerobaculia bacterium]